SVLHVPVVLGFMRATRSVRCGEAMTGCPPFAARRPDKALAAHSSTGNGPIDNVPAQGAVSGPAILRSSEPTPEFKEVRNANAGIPVDRGPAVLAVRRRRAGQPRGARDRREGPWRPRTQVD